MTPSQLTILGIIITAITSILVALITNLHNLRKANKRLEMQVKDRSMGLVVDLKTLNKLKYLVDEIFRRTKADRFLILAATNGKEDMRITSAIYEQHKKTDKIMLSIGAVSRYVEFEFDSKYRKLLKDAENVGPRVLDVDNLEPCDIKSIYQNEGVKHSIWHFLSRKPIDENNQRVFYTSVATHYPEPFTPQEQVTIKSYVGHIKKVIETL